MSLPPSLSGQTPSAEHARWFAEEVRPHESALKSWLHTRFPWLREVEDISQEALFRLWIRQTKPSGTPVRSAKAALFAIARNAVFDLGRRRAIVEVTSMGTIEHLPIADSGADVPELVSTRQELEFLAEALRDLPEGCRQVLTLRKMYGYSPKEIGERLGISEHTVRAQVAKGMRRCAEYLRHRGVKRR